MISLLEKLLELLENCPSEKCSKVKITDKKKVYLMYIKSLRSHLESNKES